MDDVYHGVSTPIEIIKEDSLFLGIPKKVNVGRYHSWVGEKEGLPESFEITCVDESGEVMGISHKEYDVKGVQFHPESILTEHGIDIMRNWINK